MISLNSYFKFFSCCFPVSGPTRSVICDTQRGRFSFIPNDLREIIETYDGRQIGELVELYGEENRETLLEYFEVLLANEFIFLCDSAEETTLFPPVKMEWDMPAAITNAIADIDENSHYDLTSFLEQLQALGCGSLEIRIFAPKKLDYLEELMDLMKDSIFEYVHFLFPHHPDISLEDYKLFVALNGRVGLFTVYNCSDPALLNFSNPKNIPLHFTAQSISGADHCGQVHPHYFNTNLKFFMEAQQHNSCLNRKISVDARGQIKNCPSMTHSFGPVEAVKLEDVIGENEFTKYWYMNKNQVSVCKDCEFRYICLDCRAFVQNPGDLLSKPLKCSYDPYSGTWGNGEIEVYEKGG